MNWLRALLAFNLAVVVVAVALSEVSAIPWVCAVAAAIAGASAEAAWSDIRSERRRR